MNGLIQEINTASKTNKGKLFLLGAILGFVTFTISIINAIDCLHNKNKDVHIEIILVNYILVLSLLLKLPYLYSKVLSRLVTIIMIIGFTISGTIYLIAYIKKH